MIQLEDRLYTSTEVAEVLGVSLRSVYRYLEEGKLDAEIKTATGRHRFSKKNIMDFLYPSGSTQSRDFSQEDVRQKQTSSPETPRTMKEDVKEEKTSVNTQQEVITPTPLVNKAVQVDEPVASQPEKVQDTTEEEPVDWLAKFREAAKKYREESETSQQTPQVTEPAKPFREETSREAFTGFSTGVTSAQQERQTTKLLYYRSSLGGLKEIAQNIDKSSRNASLHYAFTLNAGLSLFKPIKPFSLLHAYVKPQDLSFFERSLGLTPSEEASAQLSLLVSSENEIFNERQEMHGLFVVSKGRLLEDIRKMGDATLVDEAKTVL